MAEERDLTAADQDRLTPRGTTPAEAGYVERQPADPARSGNYNPIAKDPADIQRDIQHTRAEMTETVDAITARFEPEYLKEQAKDVVRSTARDAGSSMIDTIKDNPVPALLTAVGIGWLLTQGASGSDRDRRDYEEHYFRIYGRYPDYRRAYVTLRDPQYGQGGHDGGHDGGRSMGDRASDAADHARNRAGDAVEGARQKAGDLADRAGDRLHEAEEQAAYYGRQATSWLQSQVNRNPLGVGAAALAAGALVGMAVPETDAENRLIGEQAEKVKREAKSAAEEKLDQAKTVASRVADEAKDKAEDVAQKAKSEAKKEGLDEPPKTGSMSGSTSGTSGSGTSGSTSGLSTATTGGTAPKVGTTTGSSASGTSSTGGSSTGGSSTGNTSSS